MGGVWVLQAVHINVMVRTANGCAQSGNQLTPILSLIITPYFSSTELIILQKCCLINFIEKHLYYTLTLG